jgi:hypothetical protein
MSLSKSIRRRFQFSLRALFGFMTVAALVTAIFVWRQSSLQWIRDRHDTLRWAVTSDRHLAGEWVSGFSFYPDSGHLPFSLRVWGETECLKFLDIRLNVVSLANRDMPERIRRLFPEAEVRAL